MKLSKSLLLLIIALGLGVWSDAARAASKLNVVTTFAPVTTLTENVAGDAVNVEQLLPPGAEPHDFALSPGDLRKLAKADVIVENGLGLESWLDGALTGNAAVRVVASQGISADDGNPHVWLDPVLAMAEVENIRKALAARDPANAELYKRNAAAFTERLKTLDADIRAATASIPDKRLLPFHNAFHYFAKRYGFEVVGVFEEFPGREPTPRYVKKLREVIQEKQVKVLFTEPQQSPRILQSLSADLKLPIVEIDPMENGEPTAELYERVMRSNLKHLTEALRGR